MAQEVKRLASKHEDPSSIPATHVIKKRNDSCKLSPDLHSHTASHMHTYTHALIRMDMSMHTHSMQINIKTFYKIKSRFKCIFKDDKGISHVDLWKETFT